MSLDVRLFISPLNKKHHRCGASFILSETAYLTTITIFHNGLCKISYRVELSV